MQKTMINSQIKMK